MLSTHYLIMPFNSTLILTILSFVVSLLINNHVPAINYSIQCQILMSDITQFRPAYLIKLIEGLQSPVNE
jgi:hypothetical protein